MTVLKAYSFERGDHMVDDADCSNPIHVAASTNYAHTGTYSLRLGGGSTANNAWVRYALPGAIANPAISVYCRLNCSYDSNGTGTAHFNIRFRLTTGQYIDLRWNADTHTPDAYVNGVKVASGTVTVPNNTWFGIQAYMTISDLGLIQVLVDGHPSIAVSCDTQPGGAATCDYIYIYGRGVATVAPSYDYFDDLVIGYGGLLGPCRCYDMIPDGDTATVQFTPSTGTAHYAMVNETPASDANYNYTAANGMTDLLTLSDLNLAGMSIIAVAPWVRALQSEGSGDSITVGVDSGGIESTATYPLNDSAQYFHHMLNVDPASSLPWSQAGINALKLLYRSVIS